MQTDDIGTTSESVPAPKPRQESVDSFQVGTGTTPQTAGGGGGAPFARVLAVVQGDGRRMLLVLECLERSLVRTLCSGLIATGRAWRRKASEGRSDEQQGNDRRDKVETNGRL
ncbi:hypothetical protein VDGL01_01638 [Verticillium dahliae]